MAVRATMATLILRVRRLINDRTGGAFGDHAQFSDQEIQDTLDGHRRDVRSTPLRPDPTLAATLQYLDYYAEAGGAWEGGAVLRDGHYATLSDTLYTAEPLVGHWVFLATQPPPVFVTGSLCDLHGAAADLLEQWATAESLSFDFVDRDQRFLRSQKAKALREAAQTHWAQAWPRTATATRADMASADTYADRLDDRGLPYGTGYGRGR